MGTEINPYTGKPCIVTYVKCNCDCHRKDRAIIHFAACCENGFIRIYTPINMTKTLQINVEALAENTPQTWEFSKDVTGLERLAFWVIIKNLAEKEIDKMLKP